MLAEGHLLWLGVHSGWQVELLLVVPKQGCGRRWRPILKHFIEVGLGRGSVNAGSLRLRTGHYTLHRCHLDVGQTLWLNLERVLKDALIISLL